ncbi:MAG TPA: 3-deoxy-7-phosphoheptulonate synthase [Ramlibacter sp.]|jgi:3-deoxy-7-phosphoheptulonate synthase|nr:3-deoxy-7-phosphoheptulonate synthase [Ramlibacter sp.]
MMPANAARPEGAEEMPQATRLDDVRIRDVRPLMSPALLQYELPADEAVQAFVERSRAEVADIVHGRDPRLLAIVGPCSIHDRDQALEYARRLRTLADELRDDLLLVMRVYFEKPRTTVGWKGYINDPRLDGSFRINEGLRLARGLLLDVARMGLAAGTEFLDLLSPQYISDLVSWGAIGARTTESPSHRQLASGLSCPIGFKNGTDGGVQMAADALVAARSQHAFIGMTKMGVAAVFETEGNADCHIILRGGTRGPNYAAGDVEAACALLRKNGVTERVMVDCSHANSAKDYRRQTEVARDVAAQLAAGERRILGVMIESHLQPGRQDLKPGAALAHGVSITDACIGWEETEVVLRGLAAAGGARRGSPAGSPRPT